MSVPYNDNRQKTEIYFAGDNLLLLFGVHDALREAFDLIGGSSLEATEEAENTLPGEFP